MIYFIFFINDGIVISMSAYKFACSNQLLIDSHNQHECSGNNAAMISKYAIIMIRSLNGNTFRVTGPLRGEFTGHRYFTRTKAREVGLWVFFSFICARINCWVNNRETGDLRRHCAHYGVIIMCVHDYVITFSHGECPCNLVSFITWDRLLFFRECSDLRLRCSSEHSRKNKASY